MSKEEAVAAGAAAKPEGDCMLLLPLPALVALLLAGRGTAAAPAAVVLPSREGRGRLASVAGAAASSLAVGTAEERLELLSAPAAAPAAEPSVLAVLSAVLPPAATTPAAAETAASRAMELGCLLGGADGGAEPAPLRGVGLGGTPAPAELSTVLLGGARMPETRAGEGEGAPAVLLPPALMLPMLSTLFRERLDMLREAAVTAAPAAVVLSWLPAAAAPAPPPAWAPAPPCTIARRAAAAAEEGSRPPAAEMEPQARVMTSRRLLRSCTSSLCRLTVPLALLLLALLLLLLGPSFAGSTAAAAAAAAPASAKVTLPERDLPTAAAVEAVLLPVLRMECWFWPCPGPLLPPFLSPSSSASSAAAACWLSLLTLLPALPAAAAAVLLSGVPALGLPEGTPAVSEALPLLLLLAEGMPLPGAVPFSSGLLGSAGLEEAPSAADAPAAISPMLDRKLLPLLLLASPAVPAAPATVLAEALPSAAAAAAAVSPTAFCSLLTTLFRASRAASAAS